jgi:serine protease
VTVTGGGGGTETAATFVGTDTTTQGTWRGIYGSEGAAIADDAAAYPSYATVSVRGAIPFTWTANTSDVRALQRVAGAGRLASCWYWTVFSIDVALTDARVEIVNTDTGAILDTQPLAGFANGVYLVWQIRGRVTARVTNTSPYNAVVSAIFFDPPK